MPVGLSNNAQLEEAEREAEAFNARFKVGDAVNVRRDDGSLTDSRVRSEAWVCCAGHPVVMLEGIRGFYLAERVRPSE